jgi:hypothetical protein
MLLCPVAATAAALIGLKLTALLALSCLVVMGRKVLLNLSTKRYAYDELGLHPVSWWGTYVAVYPYPDRSLVGKSFWLGTDSNCQDLSFFYTSLLLRVSVLVALQLELFILPQASERGYHEIDMFDSLGTRFDVFHRLVRFTLTRLVRETSFLPAYYRRSELVWLDGFLLDFLQKKSLDIWLRKFVLVTGYVFSERMVFDQVVRIYMDNLI